MKDLILQLKTFIQNHKVLSAILAVLAVIGLTTFLVDGMSENRWLSLRF